MIVHERRLPMVEYILTRDNSGHWYVIPADKQQEFCKWVESFEDDDREEDQDQPDWAVEVGGAPCLVHFTGYSIQ